MHLVEKIIFRGHTSKHDEMLTSTTHNAHYISILCEKN